MKRDGDGSSPGPRCLTEQADALLSIHEIVRAAVNNFHITGRLDTQNELIFTFYTTSSSSHDDHAGGS